MKKKDKIKVELNDNFYSMSYDDIVANYNQIKEYLPYSKVGEHIEKITGSMLNRQRELFIKNLMLDCNISKCDLLIYIKVKKELERIREKTDSELKADFNDFFKWESVWK